MLRKCGLTALRRATENRTLDSLSDALAGCGCVLVRPSLRLRRALSSRRSIAPPWDPPLIGPGSV